MLNGLNVPTDRLDAKRLTADRLDSIMRVIPVAMLVEERLNLLAESVIGMPPAHLGPAGVQAQWSQSGRLHLMGWCCMHIGPGIVIVACP
jgi:hypothetical protein